ncbi:hypothetical protein [Bordetella bronchialis]|uniref:Uncharacterized protein n=1 Tax=Bordetella bronchialis TaxID=463025 RepID=A0A193FWX4_9BORD|nr:hypothetical protein [Bordetella bronchialis]ANN71529.1 hypothetical protein BAU08_09440 [Bordetella bronchialis]
MSEAEDERKAAQERERVALDTITQLQRAILDATRKITEAVDVRLKGEITPADLDFFPALNSALSTLLDQTSAAADRIKK